MNNKGFTLIELVVSIALITIIVIPVFAIILNFKNRQLIASDKQELVKIKNLITSDIEDDILKNGLKEANMNTESCKDTSKDCVITLSFSNDTSKKLVVNIKEKIIKYGSETYKISVENASIMSDSDMRKYIQQGYLDYNSSISDHLESQYFIQIKIPITYLDDTSDIESTNYGINIIAEKIS